LRRVHRISPPGAVLGDIGFGGFFEGDELVAGCNVLGYSGVTLGNGINAIFN
jgi:hypothetical protein